MDALTDLLQFFINAMSLGSLYALMALGLAIVYGIMRLINFAYGELVMVGGYTLLVVGATTLPWIAVAVIAVLVTVVASLLLERVAFRPVRSASPNTMLITSFAVSAFLQNFVLLTVSARPKAVRLPNIFNENIQFAGLTISKTDLITLVVCLGTLLVLTIFLRRTLLGVALRAAADDFTMTRLLGIRANWVIAAAFAISGALAGVVSLFWIGRLGSVTPTTGLTPILVAFVATVIGGMESLLGAVVGGFVLAFLTVGLQMILPQNLLDFRQAIVFLIVILVLLFRPQGLIGGSGEERV